MMMIMILMMMIMMNCDPADRSCKPEMPNTKAVLNRLRTKQTKLDRHIVNLPMATRAYQPIVVRHPTMAKKCDAKSRLRSSGRSGARRWAARSHSGVSIIWGCRQS